MGTIATQLEMGIQDSHDCVSPRGQSKLLADSEGGHPVRARDPLRLFPQLTLFTRASR